MAEEPPAGLLDPLFASEAMTAIFSDRGRLQGMLDFELGLARAEAEVGLIPAAAVAPIAAAAKAERLDVAALARQAAEAGIPTIPLVKQLTALVAANDPAAARYVHWGATSQDVMDTGLVLQIAKAIAVLKPELQRLSTALARLAESQSRTPMIGRTWLQHAMPVTFGLKAAGWLDALERCRLRLEEAGEAARVLQFGGAAGTLATLGVGGSRSPRFWRGFWISVCPRFPGMPAPTGSSISRRRWRFSWACSARWRATSRS
jgi:3-carboxy-cis,cis-muconate cycloisomerase